MVKGDIAKIIEKAVEVRDVDLDIPENEKFGDYSTNVAMILAKREKKNPRKLAQELTTKFQNDDNLSKIVEKVEVAGPGFINFWLKKDILVDNLIEIDGKKEKYGLSSVGKDKTVIIDYSSPNIAKPFGIGHLRSTIIGQAIYNLYKYLGYEVVGDNHLGDWGTQFGKLLYMLKDSSEKEIKKLSVSDLERLYVEFHKKVENDPSLEEEARVWFKKLEDGDIEAKKLWKYCVEISLAEFERVYKLLGVKIDFAFGESYYESEMKQLLSSQSVLKHVSIGEDGAKIIDLTKEGIKTPLMLLKKDGGTTYAARDLATIAFRVRKWDPDIIVYEVGAEQSFYFKQLFAAARLLGLVSSKVEFVHTAHGLYLAPDGKKFSTREGKTVKLEEVLDEAIKKATILMAKSGNLRARWVGNKQVDEINTRQEELVSGNLNRDIRAVGIGAIKYFDLMHSVQSDVVFDWDKIIIMEGNSGPYLQYTFARTQSVLANSGKKENPEVKELDSEEKSVLRSLVHFPEVISDAASKYSPNIICNYLYNLAQKYNLFYNKDKIIGSENEGFRLSLTLSVGQVLKNGLNILGIEAPERM